MSHAPSLLFLSHLSTTSLSTCTPFRPPCTFTAHWRFSLRRSIECVFRPSGWTALAYKFWARRSHWTGHLCTGQTDVLPHIEYDVDLWFSWEHGDSLSRIGFGWCANTEYAGFTTVLTGERSKCRPITSSPLLQRKLSVKFISLPRQCREPCRSILTQKKVESRNIFRQRRPLLRTLTNSRRRRSSIQTLWIGKCCGTGPWRTKRSSARRGKIWSIWKKI